MLRASVLPLSGEDVRVIHWIVRRYVRGQRWNLLANGVVLGIAAAATAGLAWVIKPVFDGLIIGQNQQLLWLLPIAIVALIAVNGACLFAQGVLSVLIEQNMTARIQSDLIANFLHADIAYIDGIHTGRTIAQATAFPGQVAVGLTRFVTALAGDIVMVVLLVGVIFVRDWQLALIALTAIPVIVIGVRKVNKKIQQATQANMAILGRLTARLTDVLNGVRLIKLHGAENSELKRFNELLYERREALLNLARIRSTASPIFELAGGIGIGLVVFFSAYRATIGGPSFGTLASMMGALIMAYRPMKRIGTSIATIQESLVIARGLKNRLEYRPSIVDRPDAKQIEVASGAVVFDAVKFAYELGHPVLKGVSFEIGSGKVTALVGRSGAGKSTIVNLIPRLYDVNGGSITIDGVDVRDATLASLRRSIAVVSQETFLFDDTVRANIAFGQLDASEQQIAAAAEAANARGFIESLPKGFDTLVGERGVRLSGGQRQRIAIARAVLKDAPILLLDEATSAVDNESEQLIQSAIWRLMEGRTVLLVAHRLSTLASAERILVIQEGEIVEAGKHDDMIGQDGVYARLYLTQSQSGFA